MSPQVLRFFGFYDEMVTESPQEAHRVRKVTILFYLEDDTVSISETKVENSGIPSGTLLKRIRVDSVKPSLLRIGSVVEIFNQKYHICDIDKFTRDYYDSIETPQPTEPIPIPVDAFTQSKIPPVDQHSSRLIPLGQTRHLDSSKVIQFLQNDGKVCRFYSVMDDQDSTNRRHFTVLYFLADNSVEIREQFPMNCGRDICPVFFSRGQIDSDGVPITKGEGDSNLLDIRSFRVGKFINLVHLNIYLYDADMFTRKYFASHFGIELGEKMHVSIPENRTTQQLIETPPYTGFGSWDDSLGSVFSLNPKQPKKDLFKLFINEGKILRFYGKFFYPKIEDEIRRFVFSYYLADDHLMIHEPPIRNSGLLGGRFLEKGVYMNGKTGELITPLDLKVGSAVEIVRNLFVIESCDQYTSIYLDSLSRCESGDVVPQIRSGSSVIPIASQVKEKLYQMMPLIHDTFRKVDRDGKSMITIDKFREILLRFGFILAEIDTLLIMQIFDKNENGQISYQEFCDAILGTDLSDDGVRKLNVDMYRELSQKSIEEKTEAEKIKRAMKELTALFYSRDNFSNRLMMEIGKISLGDKFVTSSDIRVALSRMGHHFDQRDIDRCVRSLPNTNSDSGKVDYVDFIHFIHKAFHKYT